MSKTYEWLQESPPEEDVEQRTILAKEEVYKKDGDNYVAIDTDEEKFTIAQKEEKLADIDRRIADLEGQRKENVAEIEAIKTALSVK